MSPSSNQQFTLLFTLGIWAPSIATLLDHAFATDLMECGLQESPAPPPHQQVAPQFLTSPS